MTDKNYTVLKSVVVEEEDGSADESIARESPQDAAGWLSSIFMWYMMPMLRRGSNSPLEMEDLYPLPHDQQVERCANIFQEKWAEVEAVHGEDEEVRRETAEGRSHGIFWRTVLALHWRSVLAMNIMMGVNNILRLANGPLLLALISFLYEPDADWRVGVALAGGIAASIYIASMMWTHGWRIAALVALDVRNALSAAVYAKSLRTSTVDKGEVVTLMSVDAGRPRELLSNFFWLWASPLTLLGCIALIARSLGWAVVPALVIMALIAPGNYMASLKFESVEEYLMELQQKRIKKITEVLQGILVVKLFTWEKRMEERVHEIRAGEVRAVKQFSYLLAGIMSMITGASTLMCVSTFATYVLLGHSLEPASVFTTLYLFSVAQWPLLDFPFTVARISKATASAKRLQRFLMSPELEPVDHTEDAFAGVDPIVIEEGSFKWSSAPSDVLHGINVTARRGQLIAVVGPVGAGKTSLVSSMLGEIERTGGAVCVNGSVAFVPQQAWIRNATVRRNITCVEGHDEAVDEERYERVLDVCCLRADLASLPAGDLTEIGERGINLSGGQKQRINMARAVYARRDVNLLDDPLSAVDAHVGQELFSKCIREEMGGTTRILVTHQLQFLPEVDEIWVMEGGRIVHSGSFLELTAAGVQFASLLQKHGDERRATLSGSGGSLSASGSLRSSGLPANFCVSDSFTEIKRSTESMGGIEHMESLGEDGEDEAADGAEELIEEEERYMGAVGSGVYFEYLKLFGGTLFIVVFAALSLSYEMLNASSNLWLSKWSGEWLETMSVSTGLGVYVVLALLSVAIITVRHIMWFRGAAVAAELLHNRMLAAVVGAPMAFFHRTPHGRILNRFSKDQSTVDQELPDVISDCVLCVLEIARILIVICVAVPAFVVLLIPIATVYYFVQRFYRRSSCELKRLESISNSPVYAHFSETLDGLSTIRAYGLQQQEAGVNVQRLDTFSVASYAERLAGRWLGGCLAVVGGSIALSTCLLTVLSKEVGWLNGGFAALAVSYSMECVGTLEWFVRTSSRAEAEMCKVERMLHYCALEGEAPAVVEGRRPAAGWPARGEIRFENLEMRYRPDLEPVIKGLTFTIAAGEKVGVCGRTGAGKSSLMMSLFRINEASAGRILIDGVDIATMGLADLRSRLSIIPQDPVVFSGTIGSNLDPGGTFPEYALWSALERVNLRPYVESLELGLGAPVEEGGQNLSVGQRQLLCMARALLEPSSVLVMDEATASVDPDTDAVIQRTVREAFKERTVLTIAHRLPTVIDSDRIMVLDQGKIAEFDSPERLLSRAESEFSGLVRDTGEESERFLRDAARAAAKSRRRATAATAPASEAACA
eukprot:TRINITY_DN1877_c0_g4_i2.p1 TRINITY_DN1877_c0_g4~~TRINITY_DN1877_c0_g4_i2.p1  ORF type:complete len:1344 (+),score=519.36 TRINITY_DN1877_c0_g4_i2:436-4467(+)